MWEVNVVLVVAAVDRANPLNSSVLFSEDGQILNKCLNAGTASLSLIQNLLEQYLGFTTGWTETTPTQKGIIETGEEINIVYTLLVPQEIKSKGLWVRISSLSGKNEELVRYALV